jgi:tetratricopeptide (TPR) repeat protein
LNRVGRTIVFNICLMACCGVAIGKDKGWTEVRSPHFRVLTDGSVGDARRIAKEFEQMRAVFAVAFPKMRLETGSPLLIFAPRDEASMKSLAPARWKKKPPQVAGLFETGWEKRFAIVRLDQDRPGAYQVVYHEYVHSLLHANFRWLPLWLDEGLAEYYGGTYFEKSKIYVGAPPTRLSRLRGETLIPIEKLMTQNPYVAYRGDDRRIDLFYGESWALVHFCVFGPGMEQGRKLVQFYNKLELGEEQLKAFNEVFGSLKDMQKALDNYVRNFLFQSYVMAPPEQFDEKSYASRILSVAETDEAFGSYRLWTHDLAEAREIIESGLSEDPKLAELHEDMGFVEFAEGKDGEASREFTTACDLNNRLYLSVYFRTMMSPVARLESLEDRENFHDALAQVIKINPEFAPAYVRLAILRARLNDLTTALAVSRKAEQLEPNRAGYHLLTGKILLRQGKGAQSGEAAKYVAERWSGPDHNEAMELWSAVAESQRPSLELLVQEASAPLTVQGTVKAQPAATKLIR